MKSNLYLAASAVVGLAQSASVGTTGNTCCTELANAGLGDKIVYPGQELYQERQESYWSVSAALSSECYALPQSIEDVSTIMKVISMHSCEFGIRGGGHGSFALSNAIKCGVTIDMGYFNQTTYDEERNLALIQPGGHWQDVYDTLSPFGVTVAGGRAGTVGVGGFNTGGGISFHAASHGFSCDNVANYEIVLADGTIANANHSHNADLFQAMKGGSGNFAIITRIDMYPIAFEDKSNPVIWGGNLVYAQTEGDSVIDALVTFTENIPKDENSSSIVYWAYVPAAGGTIVNAAIENTKAEIKPAAFDAYYAINVTADTTEVNKMSAVTKALGSGQPSGFRNVWFTSTWENDADIMKYAVKKFNALNEELESLMPSDESGLNTLAMFQPVSLSAVEKGIGGNVMGLERYDSSGILFLLTWAANGEENEEAAFPLLKAFMEDVEAYAKELGVLREWKFLNYAHLEQDALSTVGEEAIGKLQGASQKYDPNGVFQNLRKSGFKIPSY
ncbi:hypothetical protein B0T10DRAFT_545895 [Thelonectria olida]|uniref:FAD-binding PCMH-type domain-containing protein n=1 Tax=Thelonectria olida TaxID=1576542 RepID=A0A9P8WCR3_9HYPO|nr:hypothetical protein B0T10DRAFT_545895 [Thelonectria olida]